MSWRFRQSFKILPGLKLNLSKSGLSASIGGAPFTLNLGPRGLYGTASIPGTGVSFRQHLSGDSASHLPPDSYAPPDSPNPDEFPVSPSQPPRSLPAFDSNLTSMREIRSASTELLTSESLKELKQLIQTAYEEHEEISSQLFNAKQEKDRTTARFKVAAAAVKFHEEDGVPSDSTVVGQTWAKTNKDGSRDKRFAGNYQIPIALYGELTLKSETGLWEEFHFSNPERLVSFVKSWNAFVASFDRRISLVVAQQEEAAPPEVERGPSTIPKLVLSCNDMRYIV